MRPRIVVAALLAAVMWLKATPADEGMLIGAPDMPPTTVDSAGGLRESWGTVSLSLLPEGAEPPKDAKTRQCRAGGETPVVVTETSAGGWSLILNAYRAPIWPDGADVIEAVARNTSGKSEDARLILKVPQNLRLAGEPAQTALRLGGRTLVSLPAPPPVIKNSGCLTDARALPGWGHPNAACDPSFRNIRAGMGKIPILYRFSVAGGTSWKVALGFCESHWSEAGARPLVLHVEGAAAITIDPLAKWGQHVPGGILFEAKDANGDGWLEINVSPKPRARDENPILNAIWIFPSDARLDMAQVIRGESNAAAKYYVDVGGEKDQPLSEPGKIGFNPGEISYNLRLGPGKEERLTFLVACGGARVPAWEETAWTPDTLRAAADSVWSDWFKTGAPVSLPDAQALSQYRAALADMIMTRGQADDYYVALPRPGLEAFCYAASARIVRALDLAGFPREAERMLRLYWQKPAPKPLASLAQQEDGRWNDAKAIACPQGQALLALAQHAIHTEDRDWAGRAYPAMKAGADWVRKSRAQGKPPAGQEAEWLSLGLQTCAAAAKMLGKADDAAWMLTEAKALGPGAPDEAAAYSNLGPCVDAANAVISLCKGAK